jgi:hypothetical protein
VIDALNLAPSGAIWTEGGNVLSIGSPDGSEWQTSVMPPPESSEDDSPAFVLDRSHAWVVTTTPDSSETGNGPEFDHAHLLVNRSTDGGRTWQTATVPGDWPDTARSIAFIDARHGFLMASGGRSAQGASTIFRSNDGGASWSLVRTVDGGPDGNLGSLISVTSPTTIWAGSQPEAGPVNHPVLDVSRDGGRSWSSANLPRLGRWGGTRSDPVSPPVFLDESRGFIAVNTEDPIATGDPGENPYTLFYSTRDGGTTWSFDTGQAFEARAVVFVSAETWVVPANGTTAIEVTHDAGATWQNVAPTSADFLLWMVGNGTRLIGAVSDGGTGQSSRLVQSIDDGSTWTPFPGPVANVDPSTPPLSPSPSAIAAAKGAVQAYTRLLVNGDWAAAFASLAPASRTQWASLETFTEERSAYFKSVHGKFTVIAPAPKYSGSIMDWQSAMFGATLDVTQAVLVEVDYPALALNNAGYDLFIVQPGEAGLEIFEVR